MQTDAGSELTDPQDFVGIPGVPNLCAGRAEPTPMRRNTTTGTTLLSVGKSGEFIVARRSQDHHAVDTLTSRRARHVP